VKKSALIIRAASAVALFLGAAVQYINADEFFCPPDDGACLIAAVNQSNSNGLENTIFLDTGTYPGGTQNPLIEITGPFPLTIMGQGAEQTAIVSAIFSIRDEAILTLNNLRITRAPLVAISNSGTLIIDGVIVDDTQTLDGAISNGGQASISNSTISGNAALDGSGGGISNFGFMEIKNSTISRNSAFDRGGGIANGGTLHIINTTIARNGAAAPRGNSPGGGIDNSGNLRIINSTISENGARRGAGIFNQGTVELQNTILPLRRPRLCWCYHVSGQQLDR
jgi:hypothetical protein